MAVFSPIPVTTVALTGLFNYGWENAARLHDQMRFTPQANSLWFLPSLRGARSGDMPDLDLEGLEVELDGLDKLYRDFRDRYMAAGAEMTAAFDTLIQEVMPLGRDYQRATDWLMNPRGPYLGELGRAARLGQVASIRGSATGVTDELARLGIMAPRVARPHLEAVAAAIPDIVSGEAVLAMARADHDVRARHIGDGIAAVLDSWNRALSVVRDFLLSRMRAQLGAVDAGSPYFNKLKLENTAAAAAVRLAGEQVSRHEAALAEALARYDNRVRKQVAINQRARDKVGMLVEEYTSRIEHAAMQARAALNSNGLSVSAGFSERRRIDLEK